MQPLIDSLNQSSIKPCLIVQLVTLWTLIHLIMVTHAFFKVYWEEEKKINFDKNKAMLSQGVIVYLWIIQDLYYKAENQLTQRFSILEM